MPVAARRLLFGTAGVPLSASDASTLSAIDHIRDLGLDCLEIEFVKGVKMGYETARAVKEKAFQALFRDWISNWITMLSGIIREGIAQGSMREVDPVDTAKKISAVYQGVASRWYLDRARHSTEWARKTVRDTIEMLVKNEKNH